MMMAAEFFDSLIVQTLAAGHYTVEVAGYADHNNGSFMLTSNAGTFAPLAVVGVTTMP